MNILGIDFEEWFHPQLIQNHLDGLQKTPSIVKGIDKILDLLRKNDTSATFFVVGEILEHDNSILDKIVGNGHEIGFHTMHHKSLDSETKENFSVEIKKFAKLTNGLSKGFRAPTFSLNYDSAWAVDVLADNNYLYDSSIVPAKTTMYGFSNAERKPYRISSTMLEKNNVDGKIWEFPLAVSKFIGKTIPTAGGFYLRVLPLKIIKNSIIDYEKQKIPATFYVHSWELTPELMPRIPMPIKDRFITYHNIEKTLSKLNEILKLFKFTSFEKYISSRALNS
jgi:peptidoglycan-N-acetylglucosamine deacetylase